MAAHEFKISESFAHGCTHCGAPPPVKVIVFEGIGSARMGGVATGCAHVCAECVKTAATKFKLEVIADEILARQKERDDTLKREPVSRNEEMAIGEIASRKSEEIDALKKKLADLVLNERKNR